MAPNEKHKPANASNGPLSLFARGFRVDSVATMLGITWRQIPLPIIEGWRKNWLIKQGENSIASYAWHYPAISAL